MRCATRGGKFPLSPFLATIAVGLSADLADATQRHGTWNATLLERVPAGVTT